MAMDTKHLPFGGKPAMAALTRAQTLLLISLNPIDVLEAFHVSVSYCSFACVSAGEGQGLAAQNLIMLVPAFSFLDPL